MPATEASASGRSGGLGLGTVLGTVFIVLKLTHVIAWSWVLVLLPFIITLGLGIIGLILAVAVFFIVARKAVSAHSDNVSFITKGRF